MDNLQDAINIIFGKQCPDKVLSAGANESFHPFFSQADFLEKGYSLFTHYGLEEIINVYQKLDQDWFLDYYHQSRKKSIYYLLVHFTKHVLTESNLEPFVEYKHLLKWREMSHPLGEDLFTCSYLAYMDVRSKRRRDYFAWRPVISSNNRRLRVMLNQGIAENHFHLKGSGPVFDLSWMSLMNHPGSHDSAFRKLSADLRLLTSVSNSFNVKEKQLNILVLKAAYIRQWLFCKINGVSVGEINMNLLGNPSNNTDSYELVLNRESVIEEIETLRYLMGYHFKYNGGFQAADYAIPKEMSDQNFNGSFLLVGERKFLYENFKLIYTHDPSFLSYQHLFYAYLLIKYTLRSELIQINLKTGFGNFLKYQDRKELFITEGSIYEVAFVGMAVNDSLKFNKLLSFETRIAPKLTSIQLRDSLDKYHAMIDEKAIQRHYPMLESTNESESIRTERHFYTLHFIKKSDQRIENALVSSVTSRHQALRSEIKRQAFAIVGLRESFYDKSQLIRGIDAASSEFSARPEVFAHAFRYLKDHKLSGAQNQLRMSQSEHKLSATFHVGEDFYDVVDGIRAIDEAILFLGLNQGDRVGHALALGIDVAEFYCFKKMKLMLPKEMILDNIVWLLARIRKFGIDICRTEVNRLEKTYEGLFREIYSDSLDNTQKNTYFSHMVFFDSWKLRGDDPNLYQFDTNNLDQITNLTYWDRCKINYSYPSNSQIRKSRAVQWLYQQYHFNPRVKSEGASIRQFEITQDYIKLVAEVQRLYRNHVKSLNIGVECNPTSNFLIGTFGSYAKHPIMKFYNLGLETSSVLLDECPQLFVSINTDDQGIFNTSLENEYALMAIALEKELDSSGRPRYSPTVIYQWLDNIRKMGLEQSFNL